MPNALYSKLRSVAAGLLAKYGREVTLRRKAAAAYNPATSSATLTPVDYPLNGAVFTFAEGQTTFAGSMVQRDDRKLLLESKDLVPTTDDLIIIGEVQWGIVSVKETSPAGDPVMYECLIRK